MPRLRDHTGDKVTYKAPLSAQRQGAPKRIGIIMGEVWANDAQRDPPKHTHYSLSARRKERSPKRMIFDKHSSFTDLTQRSAYAFKFGLRAGRGSVLTPPDSIIARKEMVYFVSRSCRR